MPTDVTHRIASEEPALAPVMRLLVRVRRRLRAQAALDGAARAAPWAAGAALAGALVSKWAPVRGAWAWAAAGALLVGGAAVGALGRLPLRRVARSIDAAHGLGDRLGSALELAALPTPNVLVAAAIDDAARAAARLLAERAAPWTRPRGFGRAGLVGAMAIAVWWVRFPPPASHAAQGAAPAQARLAPLEVDPSLLEPERRAAAALAREIRIAGDGELEPVPARLLKLFDDIAHKERTRREVLDELGRIEQDAAERGRLDERGRRMRAAGEALGKSEGGKSLGEALRRGDSGAARRELAAVGAQAGGDAKSQRQRAEIERAASAAGDGGNGTGGGRDGAGGGLARLESELRKHDEARRGQELAEETRELVRRMERGASARAGGGAGDERRGGGGGDDGSPSGADKGGTGAAAGGANQGGPNQRQATGGGANQGGARQAGTSGGSEGQGGGTPGEGAGQGGGASPSGGAHEGADDGRPAPSAPRRAGGRGQEGREGHGGGAGDAAPDPARALRDYLARAGGSKASGEQRDGNAAGRSGQGGGSEGDSHAPPGPIGSGGPGSASADRAPGADKGKGDTPGQSGQGAGGIGDAHDDNLLGDATSIEARRRLERLSGKGGSGGPGRAETIRSSSERGFATEGYQRVYSDYSAVVDEVLDKERVPPGFRFYVKRYFQLIRPRE